MRWPVFIFFAYVTLCLDVGLRRLFELPTGTGPVTPDLMLILVVFIAAWSQTLTACSAGLILGLLLDLQSPMLGVDGKTTAVLVGPHALGFLLAAYATLQVRAMFYRSSIFSIAGMVLFAGTLCYLLSIALLTFRGVISHPLPGYLAADELYLAFLKLIYTMILSVPFGYVLGKTMPIWNFVNPKAVGAYGRKVLGGE
jgi:hypothetical protein